jgi:RES domain-containing protein
MGRGGLMLLWRLSIRRYANIFDGGYGLLFDGRWNTVGHAVTYCATSPSLCVLENLVHIEDPALCRIGRARRSPARLAASGRIDATARRRLASVTLDTIAASAFGNRSAGRFSRSKRPDQSRPS